MHPIPTVITLVLALSGATLAAPAAPGKSAGAGPAAADTAKPAAPKPSTPLSGSPAVLRGAGNPVLPGSIAAETLDTDDEVDSAIHPLTVPGAAEASGAEAPAPTDLPVPTPARRDSVKASVEPALVEAPGVSALSLGGTFQIAGIYHDFAADRDADKSLSLAFRRARVDLIGVLDKGFGFEGQFRLEGDGRRFGTEAVYLSWKPGQLFGIKGGKLKRPFSQEAMQSSKSLFTVDRGTLYQTFLSEVTGYSAYDLGVVFHGGFVDDGVPVSYEAGIFNGKQSDDPADGYANQHYEARDKGFKAKDLVFRLVAQPFKLLKAEAALSTKAAEDRSDPADFAYHVNTAYQVGADFGYGRLRLLGEAAWGDNHQGRDARIISGTSLFFAFYGMGVWREDYSRGRASELVLKLEGLDPDFEPGSSDGAANDGRLHYTLGCNWFFTPKVAVLANYGVLQPVTKVPGDDVLVHHLDALWRMNF